MQLNFPSIKKADNWVRIGSGWDHRQDGKEIAHGGISFTIGNGVEADKKTPKKCSLTLKENDRLMVFKNSKTTEKGPSHRLMVNTAIAPAKK